jgi:hypothetical protein
MLGRGGRSDSYTAQSTIDEEDPIKPVCEWTFCNVLKLPKDKRKVWLGKGGAFDQELEALQSRGVFGELQDLP